MDDPAEIGNAFVEQFSKPEVMSASPAIAPIHKDTISKNELADRDFQGDKAVSAYASQVGDLYQQRLEKLGLGEHVPAYRPKIEDAIRKQAQGHVVQTLSKRMQDEGETGRDAEYWARRATLFSGMGFDTIHALETNKSSQAIQSGQGSAFDYQTIARQLAREQEEDGRSVGGKLFDFASQGPAAIGEWLASGGTAPAAQGLGVARQALSQGVRTIARQAPTMGARVAAGVARDTATQAAVTDNGLEFKDGESFGRALAGNIASDVVERGMFGAIDPLQVRAGKGYVEKTINSLMNIPKLMAAGELSQDAKAAIESAPQGGGVWRLVNAKTDADRAKAIKDLLVEGAGFGLFEVGMHGVSAFSKGTKENPKAPQIGVEELIKDTAAKELANVQPPPADAQAASPAALPPDATAAGAAPPEAAAPTEGGQGAGGASLSAEDPGARQAAQVNGAQAAEGAGGELAQPGEQAQPTPQIQGGADRATESGPIGAVARDAGSTGPAAAPAIPGTRSGVLEPPIVQFRKDAAAIESKLPPVAKGQVRLWRGNRPGELGSNPQFTNDLPGIALPFQKAYGGKLSYVDVPEGDLPRYEQRTTAAPGAEFVLPPEIARKATEALPSSGVLDLYQNAAKLSDADYQVGLSKVEQELESMPKKQLKDLWQQMGMVGKASAEKIADLIQKRRDAFIQTQLINPNKKRPGIMDWEPPKAKQALPPEEMPKFDDTEAGRKAEAAWRAAHPEYGNEFNAGDNARPGATVLPPRPQVYDPLEQAIKEMAAQHLAMGEEGAMASGFPGLAKFQDATWKYLVNTTGKIRDNLRQFAGHVVPATTRVDRESGEALTRYASAANFAREAAPNYIDRVMGEDATEADRRIAGAVITERRLRKIRDVLQAEGDVAGAAQVKTIIGVEDSPLKTEADYDRYLNSQKMQGILARYKEHFVPKMETNFRRAQEMEPDDPIETRTQIEGEPVNLKFIREGEDAKAPVFFGQRQGNLKNTGLRRLGFSRQAKGNATGYDIDLGSIIENSLAKSEELAAKHDLFRTMEANGAGQRGKRGERIEINGEPAREIPNVYQQKPIPINMGMEAINIPTKTSFYVDARAYDELRQALAVDQAPKFPVAAAAANLLNTSALASSVEAVYHSKNLLSFLFTKPGVRLGDFMGNLKDVWKNDPETRARLAELSRIGAMKAEGLESGQSKYNPLKFMGKFLDFLQRSVRLTADDAFERLKRSNLAEDTETNKRDFINQLGQYNKRLQNKMLVLFRNSGLGPFATAGTNYYMQGLRALTFNPGLKATSASAALRLRMEVMGKMAAVIGGTALANYALWGRVDGDDETPLGAIKVGEGDGKTQYFDLTSLTGFTRGLRETGLLSLAEGARKGDETAKPTDKAVDDIIHSAMHPFVGPIGQFAYTAATGKNTIGMQVAKEVSTAKTSKGLLKAEAMGKPPPGSSQKWENVKAALRNANPAIGVLGGYDRPNDEATPGEKAWKLLGPFGVKTKTHPKVYSKGTKRGQ